MAWVEGNPHDVVIGSVLAPPQTVDEVSGKGLEGWRSLLGSNYVENRTRGRFAQNSEYSCCLGDKNGVGGP